MKHTNEININYSKIKYYLIACIFLFRNSLLVNGNLPAQSSCGLQTVSPSISGNTLNRIIGGSYAVSNSWPWMVSLRQYTGTQISTHFCGGS